MLLNRILFAHVVLALGFGTTDCLRAPRTAPNDARVNISEATPLPAGRASQAGGNLGGKVLIAGGSAWSEDKTRKIWFADSLVFQSGQWMEGPSLDHPVAEMMFASDGTALYMAGGTDGTNTSDRAYRFRSHGDRIVIENLPALPAPTTGGAGALLDGVFYVASGYAADGSMTDRFWMLDIGNPEAKWEARAPVPPPMRAYPALVACDGCLYLLGGCAVEGPTRPFRQVFKTVHRYDPDSNAWNRLPDLPTGGQGWVADAICRHHLLIVGRGDTKPYDEVWEVDLRDLSARGIGTLSAPTFGGPLVRVGSGCWWFIGGELLAPKSRTPAVTTITLRSAPH